jgi:hypothetical protein
MLLYLNFKLSDLAQDIQQGLNEPKHQFKKQSLLATLVPPNNRYGLNIVEFYNLRVKDTDLGSVSSTLNREKMLTLSLIRQPPSFARIRRTWETMRTFWEGVESDFEAAKVIVEVDERIQIQGKFTRNGSASELSKVSHTYELKIDGINVSVVCISSSGEFFTFITADNLQRVAPLLSAPKEAYINYKAAADYVVEKIEMSRKSNIAFEIQESAGYNHSNQILGTLQVSDAHLKQFKYTPAITILAEPRTFMAIVPADKAINVANAIKAKYEVEMGKVRNRLPLTLGIVFAGSRTPLPAILDAGRRMLGQPTKADLWEVVGKVNKKVDEGKPNSVIKEVELTLKSDKNGYKFSINVPTVMGDEKVEDAWYPYWCVEEDSSGNRPSGRQRQFESWNGKEWVHVLNLEVSEEKDDTDKKGDTVHFAPSRFDFEFLDTAARRFEISYEDNKRRGSVHPARPYYLEQLNDFTRLWGMLSNNLFTSQIHNLIEAIETKRLEWQAKSDNPTFENMIRMILKNADWKIPADYDHLVDIDYLVGAACSGQLADVFKLYVRILKKPSEVDKVEETNDNN